MNVLMVGVGPKRVGGMWTVAEEYINNYDYNNNVNLKYISTSTNGSIFVRFIYMILGYIKILYALNTQSIDIVHIHIAEKGSTFRKGRVAKWSKKRCKKVILHLHAGPFMAWYDSLSQNKQEKVKEIFGYADTIFVLGNYWKNELARIFPEEKLIVLYNGVKCPDSNPYNSKANNIVYFGVMRKEKGTYDLIDAVRLINDKLPKETKVILCGNDLEGNISQYIQNAGLSDRFELVGWVTGSKKEIIYSEAMIDVLPSYFEGLSMTVLEAMSKGIPVITTNISTMPEVVGKNGVLIQPGNVNGLADALLRLAYNDVERQRISQDEFLRVNNLFSISGFINKTLAEYKRLVD